MGHGVGARVAIHDQNEKTYPDEEGIDLQPGMSTSIGVRRVKLLIALVIWRWPEQKGSRRLTLCLE